MGFASCFVTRKHTCKAAAAPHPSVITSMRFSCALACSSRSIIPERSEGIGSLQCHRGINLGNAAGGGGGGVVAMP